MVPAALILMAACGGSSKDAGQSKASSQSAASSSPSSVSSSRTSPSITEKSDYFGDTPNVVAAQVGCTVYNTIKVSAADHKQGVVGIVQCSAPAAEDGSDLHTEITTFTNSGNEDVYVGAEAKTLGNGWTGGCIARGDGWSMAYVPAALGEDDAPSLFARVFNWVTSNSPGPGLVSKVSFGTGCA